MQEIKRGIKSKDGSAKNNNDDYDRVCRHTKRQEKKSLKIIASIGAVLVTIGVAGLAYSLTMAASKCAVYQQSDVPRFPDAYRIYTPWK